MPAQTSSVSAQCSMRWSRGRRAFQGDTKAVDAGGHPEGKPKAGQSGVEALPKEVERIISRCLRKERERRWQTMADLKSSAGGTEGGIGFRDAGSRRGTRSNSSRQALVDWCANRDNGRSCSSGNRRVVLAGPISPYARKRPPECSPLTSYAGSEQSPSFSPDGNQVVFSWNGEKQDNTDIYIKLVGSPDPRPLDYTTPQMTSARPFRRMESQLAFSGGRMSVTPSSSFLPLAVQSELWLTSPYLSPLFFLPSFAWFPNGKWVVLNGLTLLSKETGETRRLTIPPKKEFADVSPAVSPDGHTVAFSRAASLLEWDIYLLDLTEDMKPKGEPRQLTTLKSISRSPVWTPNGQEIIFTSGGICW